MSRQGIYNTLIDNDFDVLIVIDERRFIPEFFRKKDEIHYSRVMSHLETIGWAIIEYNLNEKANFSENLTNIGDVGYEDFSE